MNKFFLFSFLMLPFFLFAQIPAEKITKELSYQIENENSANQILIWITFTDKGGQLQKLYKAPEDVVSEKSLERRSKVLPQSQLIDMDDLPVNQNYITQVEDLGFKVKQKSKWFNSVSGFANEEMINKISSLQFVKKIDAVKKYKKSNDQPENESKEINQNFNKSIKKTSLDYGDSYTQLNQINVIAAHELGYAGQDVTIGVMDAGVNRLNHDAFQSINIIAMYDFVNNDSNIGDESDMGEGSHGTYTLSAIGGYLPGKIIGPAYSANFILAKTENTDSETPIEEDNWIAALEWADSIGVDVTSTSLGYNDFDPAGAGGSDLSWQDMNGNTAKITIAADLAVKKGILVFNSAGNENYNPDHNTIIAPADGDSVIAVGAVTSSGSRASFSSVGNTFDGRIKPDIMAMGVAVACASSTNNSFITFINGTSLSCPLAAGAGAVILSANKNLTPMQIRDALRNTASNSSSPNREMGWGIIDVIKAMNYLQISTGEIESDLPETFKLFQNYPNPFNPNTKIKFRLNQESNVELSLYNILGQRISVLLDQNFSDGEHEYLLSGRNLSSGIYFVRLKTGDNENDIKIILLK